MTNQRVADVPANQPKGPAANGISCLMLTVDRFDLFKSSYLCYCNQTYPQKELVIVTEGTPEYQERIRDFLASDSRPDVHLIALQTRQPLGALRNISVEAASGPFICQWDDDDLYHPRRLQDQIEHLRRESAQACCLTEQLQLFWSKRTLYWCDWRQKSFLGRKPSDRLIPGTLLANKSVLPRYRSELRDSEDTAILEELIASEVPVAGLGGKGYLYIYAYHGKNTFDSTHHELITQWAGLTKYDLEARANVIEAALKEYPIEPPLYIMDKNEARVFTWDGQTLIPTNPPEQHIEPATSTQRQPREQLLAKITDDMPPERREQLLALLQKAGYK